MQVLLVVLLILVTSLPVLGRIKGKVVLPFGQFLLQQPPFEVEAASTEDLNSMPPIGSVPLVMRILFEEAERVSEGQVKPQGGDFQALARSIQPTGIEELGLQRVVLDFPPLDQDGFLSGVEAWLVFQTRDSGNNCTQVLTVYENKPAKKALMTVPLISDPLLVMNITQSMLGWRKGRPSYVAAIEDSTSYVRDDRLHSFANYIDCSLARACEVLELHDPKNSPVLLLLAPELAAMNLLEPAGRYRRHADWSGTREESEEEHPQVNCHLQEWVVNIEQLGWDWLVYPERIPLNLCVGTCPVLLDRHFNATSHAVARGLYRLVLGQESKPENTPPCCVPVKYRRFNMLIEKSPGIISLETSSDLSASQCGCR